MLNISDFDGEELLALARLDANKGELAEALYKVKAGLKLANFPSGCLALAGNIYAQLGLFERAKGYLSDYISLCPDSITERFRLGMVHLDTNDASGALMIWTENLQLAPTHPPSLYYSAVAHLQLDQETDARRHIDVLLKSAEEDNLFYGKGRELLSSIKARSSRDRDGAVLVPQDARSEYGTN